MSLNTYLLEGAYLEAMLQLEKEKLELERTFSTLLRWAMCGPREGAIGSVGVRDMLVHQVQWDEATSIVRSKRVSPWEIQTYTSRPVSKGHRISDHTGNSVANASQSAGLILDSRTMILLFLCVQLPDIPCLKSNGALKSGVRLRVYDLRVLYLIFCSKVYTKTNVVCCLTFDAISPGVSTTTQRLILVTPDKAVHGKVNSFVEMADRRKDEEEKGQDYT
ncbi:hypothetical protein Tco_0974987 [Tanacetum coccineum]|uniref:Uncharacterized protein n=1 Tax=Tanacetum coccineum TaxID=301880 RepID=A0ABQ5ED37_9ASTR